MGIHSSKNTDNEQVLHEIAVKKFVDKILSNVNINQSTIPDAIERSMYEKVFSLLLLNVKEVLETVRIELVDHEVTLTVRPKKITVPTGAP